jgi:hypothetical protein
LSIKVKRNLNTDIGIFYIKAEVEEAIASEKPEVVICKEYKNITVSTTERSTKRGKYSKYTSEQIARFISVIIEMISVPKTAAHVATRIAY